MTRRLVTFSVEVYGDTPEEVRKNAEYIREELQESLSELGEHGDGYSTKIVSIGDEPCPPTEDELEEEREEQARKARASALQQPGAFIVVKYLDDEMHCCVHADDRDRPGGHLWVDRHPDKDFDCIEADYIKDILPWNPVCQHGYDSYKGYYGPGCAECARIMKSFLHGLVARPSR